MKVTIGNMRNFFERFRKENPTLQISIPVIGGLSANIPLAETGKLHATRKGIDRYDYDTPFVRGNTEDLISFYEQYKNNKEYKFCRSPYAETIPLKKNNDGFVYGMDVDELKIKAIGVRYVAPSFLKKHYEGAVALFKDLNKIRWNEKEKEWENNKCVRIAEWNTESKTVTIQPATYFDQVGTNLTIDWASGLINENPVSTIRNDIESHENCALPKLNTSILANTLGVAVVLVNDKSKEVLVPIRGSEQAIMAKGKGQFHCSASGVFELDDFPSEIEELTFDIFMKGMEKEIEEEIGLSADLYNLVPLAFTRELVRGGKPQLFFIAKTDIDIRNIKTTMKNAQDNWEFINEDELPIDSQLHEYLDAPLKSPQEMFSYEGWMALKIALAYLYRDEPPFPIC